MRVRVSRRAEMDLAVITDFIALDNPERADEFEEELLERARGIGRAPLAYAERPDLRAGLRSCVHGAYVIFFTVNESGVRIERILHGARDLIQDYRPSRRAGPRSRSSSRCYVSRIIPFEPHRPGYHQNGRRE